MKILIAEDDYTSQIILTAILNNWGYDLIVVGDGKQAWEILQKEDAPKLVILDWNMPEMDGLEVCRKVRQHIVDNPPYVILLTAKGDKCNIVEGLDAGANDYITKPYDTEELRARVRVGQRMITLQDDLNRVKNALAHEATHDPLTGVYNRRAILERLDCELSRMKRQGGELSIGICDIDFFKQVNDRYGHQVGDDVLCAFTCAIQANLRDYDLIGRYGGEEFLIVASGSVGVEHESLFYRLCLYIEKNAMQTRAGGIKITMSIGVARGNGDCPADKLLEAADSALYQAKKEGRNRVIYAARNIEGKPM